MNAGAENRDLIRLQGFRLDPMRVVHVLLAIAAVLLVLSLIGQVSKFWFGHGRLWGFVPEFDVDAESNIPTFFSSSLLLASAGLTVVIGRHESQGRNRWTHHWMLMGLAILFLSADEASSLHERLIIPLRLWVNADGWLHYPWVLPAGAALIAFCVAYRRFLLELPRRVSTCFVIAGCTYVTGALGLEILGGKVASTRGVEDFTYAMITHVEEGLEMVGAILMLGALLLALQVSTQARSRAET